MSQRKRHSESNAKDERRSRTNVSPPNGVFRYCRETKGMLLKNVVVLGLIFFLLFGSYLSLADLQSSLFTEDGLGVICQSIIYVTFIVSSLTLPTFTITMVGHKWALVLAIHSYVIWMAANGSATWITMTISSVLIGIGAAPLWTVFGSYTNALATRYATLTGKTRQAVLSLFFGIVIAMLKSSRLLGSLLSWSILQADTENATMRHPGESPYCGINDCPWLNSSSTNSLKPPMKKVWILVGCCVSIGIVTILISVLCLDSLPPDWYISEIDSSQSTARKIRTSVFSAGMLHGNVNQLLLIPLFLYQGMMLCFFQADFTKSFVTCLLGIWTVGLVMLPNSVVGILASLLSGRLANTVKTLPQLIIAFFLDASMLLLCIFWIPRQSQLPILLVISAVFGVTDAVWQAQTNAVIGTIFPTNQAAYGNYRAWNAAGCAFVFVTKNAMCVRSRIYLLMCVLLLNIVCSAIVHKRHKRRLNTDGYVLSQNIDETKSPDRTKQIQENI